MEVDAMERKKTRRYLPPFLTVAATLLISSPPAWAQGDLSAGSPLAGDAPLVELLLSQDWTREEMAKRLLQALEVGAFEPDPCVPGEEMFDDVPANGPFCPWIEELVRRGLTSGCQTSLYCPASPVTRSQMAVFLVRTIEAAVEQIPEGPTGPAGGDLAGSYPNPTIGPEKVTGAKIGPGAVTTDKIANGAVTAAKLESIIEVAVDTPTVAPDEFSSATATCPAGTRLLSGGFSHQSSGGYNWLVSQSRKIGNGWFVRGKNQNISNANLQVFAYCLE